MPGGTVRVGGFEAAYSEMGSGPPVLLLHSGGLSSRQWGRLAEALAPRHRVLLLDFIAYGRSSGWPDGELFHFILDALAVEAVVDRVGEPVHLVGHSYGGFLALLAALHRPRLVRSLALYEPVAFGVLHSSGDAAGLSSLVTARVDATLRDTAAGGQEPWLRAFVEYWNEPGAWERLGEPVRASFRAVGWKLYGEVRSLLHDRTPHQAYALLSAATLLMRGETSPVAARRVVDILGSVVPGARVRIAEGGGHMGPLTHAAAVNGWIAEHLASAG